jgi:hypothetical protein
VPEEITKSPATCHPQDDKEVPEEVPEEISKSRSLARSLSLHKLSFLHTQNNDEQGGLMKVEKEALQVPLRRW